MKKVRFNWGKEWREEGGRNWWCEVEIEGDEGVEDEGAWVKEK